MLENQNRIEVPYQDDQVELKVEQQYQAKQDRVKVKRPF